MNELTRLSIWRPLLILMVILALVVMGARSYLLLPVENMPQVDIAIVSVVTVYPGASPEDVEQLIVQKIEDATAGIAGIDHIQSVSQEGVGVTILRFQEGTDADQAAIDVQRQLAAIRSDLPQDAQDPAVIKADIGSFPIVELALSGPQSQAELFDLADRVIKPRLQAIPGVASVDVSGGQERAVLVDLDAAKMSAYGVSLAQVSAALAVDNLTAPAGSFTLGNRTTPFRSVGRLTGVEDVAGVVVAGKPSAMDLSFLSELTGAPRQPEVDRLVSLGDIATVTDGLKERTQIVRLNGEEGIILSMVKTGDANVLRVSDQIKAEAKALEKSLPSGAQLKVVLDTATYTRASVGAVQEDLLLAILITGLVLLLFLHMWRSTVIVLLAIPTSLISTFLVMWAFGFSLNMLTLLAMALTVGILVDDAIVVLENIVRHLNQGETPFEAALNGRAEIGWAALAITLADVVVYVPVAFSTGIIGAYFRSYGLTIAVAVLFSLFISFTLTPMLASRWLRREEEATGLWGRFGRAWDGAFDVLADLYARLLDWCLRRHAHRLLVIGVAVISLAAALGMAGSIGSEFVPQEDTGFFRVSVNMPPGTSLETTAAAVAQAERIIVEAVPEATTVLSRIGASQSLESMILGTAGGASSNGAITVRLRDKGERERSAFQIIADVRTRLAAIPDAKTQLTMLDAYGTSDTALEVQVVGPDIETVRTLAGQVAGTISAVPGVADVMNVEGLQTVEYRAVLDRKRVNDMGLSAVQVGSALRTALSGAEVGTIQPPAGNEIDIVVRAREADRQDAGRLSRLPLGFLDDQPITLDQVATIHTGLAPTQLQRLDRQRYLSVRGNVYGRSVDQVTTDMLAAIEQQVTFPEGYRVQMGTQTEMQQEGMLSMVTALALSIILLYMLLVALYESFSHPLAIMFSLPVAMVGAMGSLLIAGKTINLVSMLGMILLVGIVTKNAILIADFADVLRRERGMSRREALVEAGRMRLRPILMTTFAIVFAMVPIALRTEAGAELRTPMAVVIIGGALSSLLLSLVLVPTVYTYLDGLGAWITRTLGRRTVPTGALSPAEGQVRR